MMRRECLSVSFAERRPVRRRQCFCFFSEPGLRRQGLHCAAKKLIAHQLARQCFECAWRQLYGRRRLQRRQLRKHIEPQIIEKPESSRK